MKPETMAELARLITKHGTLHVTHSSGGSGVGLSWTASINGWPFCSGGTIIEALEQLVTAHLALERRELQKRINEILLE